MQKPPSYDKTQISGNYEPIALGGHKMVIKRVAETKSKSGLSMLTILFDFADNDVQPRYFMKMFNDDIRPDKKWPSAGTTHSVVDAGTDYGVKNLKTFITCVEKSNPGFSVQWGDNFDQQFKGKLIGGVFRVEKDWYNNKEVNKHRFAWFRSVEGIENVEVPVERTTKEFDNHTREEAFVGAGSQGTDFMDIPDGIEDELPFN